jgi:hypothetical protein
MGANTKRSGIMRWFFLWLFSSAGFIKILN